MLRFGFHQKCGDNCESKLRFDRNFEVDQRHILEQGLAKNPQRLALSNDIVAVIQQGKLRSDRCKDGPRVELAVEGLINDFRWLDMRGLKTIEVKEPSVQIRVVVREASPKSFIVTAYILDPPENSGQWPEVTREIW